jgi:hypothetical protein
MKICKLQLKKVLYNVGSRRDNSKYSGEFHLGDVTGKGSYTYSNGTKYIGQLKKGIKVQS